MNNNFVTFAIGGRRSVHRQANFAALSVLARSSSGETPSFHIVTDQPEHYRWLGDRVTVLPVDEKTLEDWAGPHGFFWRVKLCAIQHVGSMTSGNLIYVDSDVVCRAPLQTFFDALDQGRAFMHMLEYDLLAKGGRGGRLWNEAGGRRFGKFQVDRRCRMWNAGVVALPGELAGSWIADALECTDAMSAAGVSGNLLEQFSLSMSLDRNADLNPAADWFIHYWGNKTPWNALIARFLGDVLIRRLTVAEACEELQALELSLPVKIPRKRIERINNSLRKALFPRDHSVVAQLTAELAD